MSEVKNGPAMETTWAAVSGVSKLCDFFGGIHLYGAIVTALYERERTGAGRVVEASMFESVYPSLMSSLGLYFGSGGAVPGRTGNRHAGLAEAPYNVYPATDGYVAIIGVSEQHWVSLATLIGRPDLIDAPGWATRRERVERMEEVDELVAAYTSQYPRDELLRLLRDARVPCAPVRDIGEVVTDQHLHERGMLQEIEHPELGPLTVPHSPLRYEGTPRLPLTPSPKLGEHSAEILREWLGLGPDEIDELERREVI